MLEDDTSELAKRLKAWREALKVHEQSKFMEKIETTEVNLEENEIHILLVKLMQVERLLKDIRSKKARQAHQQLNVGYNASDLRRNISKQGDFVSR